MKKLSLFDKLAFFVNSIVAFLLLLSYVIPYVAPKNFAFISLLSLAVPILIIINILFFVFWLLKVKKQLLLSLVVLAIGFPYLGSLYKFSSSKDVQDSNNISVMSYNVRLFNLYEWIEEKDVPLKINSFIEEQDPDIISFQEYKANPKISLNSYTYKFEHLERDAKIGQVIVSKFPIINSGSVEFPNTNNNAIYIDIVRNKDTVRVYNIHLQSLHISADMAKLKAGSSDLLVKKTRETFKIQQEQTALFLAHKDQSSYKTIITGDFNNTAYSYVYRQIKGDDFNDAFEVAGNGFGRTFDFKFFPIRIDFILSDNNFQINGFKTFQKKFSDHYPIMAKLSLH